MVNDSKLMFKNNIYILFIGVNMFGQIRGANWQVFRWILESVV